MKNFHRLQNRLTSFLPQILKESLQILCTLKISQGRWESSTFHFKMLYRYLCQKKRHLPHKAFYDLFPFPLKKKKKKKGKTIQPEHSTGFAFCSTQWQQIQEQNRKSWKVKSNPKWFTHLPEPLWRILRIDSSVIQTASPTGLWEVQIQTIFGIFIPKCPLSSR